MTGAFAQRPGKVMISTATVSYLLPADNEIWTALRADPAFNQFSSFEQGILYSINFARKNPKLFLEHAVKPFITVHPEAKDKYYRSLVEEMNRQASIGIMMPDKALLGTARGHAADLASHNIISHNSTNGATFQERMAAAGWGCGSEAVNMAPVCAPEEVIVMLLIDSNVPNLGHRRSLLNPKYSYTGVGKAVSRSYQYTVIDLGCK